MELFRTLSLRLSLTRVDLVLGGDRLIQSRLQRLRELRPRPCLLRSCGRSGFSIPNENIVRVTTIVCVAQEFDEVPDRGENNDTDRSERQGAE